jgi:hypothetical protein
VARKAEPTIPATLRKTYAVVAVYCEVQRCPSGVLEIRHRKKSECHERRCGRFDMSREDDCKWSDYQRRATIKDMPGKVRNQRVVSPPELTPCRRLSNGVQTLSEMTKRTSVVSHDQESNVCDGENEVVLTPPRVRIRTKYSKLPSVQRTSNSQCLADRNKGVAAGGPKG